MNTNDNSTAKNLKFSKNRHSSPLWTFALKMCLLALMLLILLYSAWYGLKLQLDALFFISLGSAFILLLMMLLGCFEQNMSRKLAAFLSMMTENAGACCWEWDITPRKIRLIPGGGPLFGKEVRSVDDFKTLVHPEDLTLLSLALAKMLTPEDTLQAELRLKRLSGEWRWYAIKSNAAIWSDGKLFRVMGSMLDIHDYRQALEAAGVSERRFGIIFQSAPGGMVVTDSEGHLLEANQAFCDILGYEPRELKGIPILSLSERFRDLYAQSTAVDIFQKYVLYHDNQSHVDEIFVRKDGRRVVLDFGLSELHDGADEFHNYVFSGVDVTQQRRHVEKLKLFTENQRRLFDFLYRFSQFEGIEQLFEALKENLPKVVAFSSLRLIVPSFLGRAWVMDNNVYIQGTETSDLVARCQATGQAQISSNPAPAMAIPLTYKEKVWGVLALEAPPSQPFTEQEMTLTRIVANNIALYLEERSGRVELNTYHANLQTLHTLIHTLLHTRNRDHLVEGMLAYLKNTVPSSACVVYLSDWSKKDSSFKLQRLAWYDEEDVPIPHDELAQRAVTQQSSFTEDSLDGQANRIVSPIVFQTHSVGAVDLYKPSGLSSAELKVYQLLIDYVAGFWVLYDLLALREEEASIDPLTGIWNRRSMINHLQSESDRITRYGGNACVVIADMGNFKRINDNYGHIKGDEVLVKVATAIKNNLRTSDNLGRYGGDEFILLLPNVTNEDAWNAIDRLQEKVAQLKIKTDDADPDSSLISVMIDFGTALFPGGAESLMDTIKLADEDMYARKIARKAKNANPEAPNKEERE